MPSIVDAATTSSSSPSAARPGAVVDAVFLAPVRKPVVSNRAVSFLVVGVFIFTEPPAVIDFPSLFPSHSPCTRSPCSEFVHRCGVLSEAVRIAVPCVCSPAPPCLAVHCARAVRAQPRTGSL